MTLIGERVRARSGSREIGMRSRWGSKNIPIVVLAWVVGALGISSAGSAQVLVGMQQRLFEKYGDGTRGPDAVPCCLATPMNPVPTVDARTVARNLGPYFSEFKNRTAMVGDLLGLGTPAALYGDGPEW